MRSFIYAYNIQCVNFIMNLTALQLSNVVASHTSAFCSLLGIVRTSLLYATLCVNAAMKTEPRNERGKERLIVILQSGSKNNIHKQQ